MSGIFISYRREDSDGSTRAIYESLVLKFGEERLFLDVEAIKGSDFPDAIAESLDSCGVFLAVIGPIWLNVKPDNDPNGLRRLDHPGDYVRQEVATALRKGHALPVIPVLVRGASMPTAEALPEELKDLAYRSGLNMNNLDWNGDMAKLVDAMREIDDNWEGFITSESDGSSTLDFRVTAGEQRFKFTNKDTNTERSGTFSVNRQQTRFIPRIRNGGTRCAVDVALGGI